MRKNIINIYRKICKKNIVLHFSIFISTFRKHWRRDLWSFRTIPRNHVPLLQWKLEEFFKFITLNCMFLYRDKTGADWIVSNKVTIRSTILVVREKTWDELIQELERVNIYSHTWLRERRELIKTWSPYELIRAYSILRIRILQRWTITHADKILLEALNKEWIEEWGTHSNRIWTHDEVEIVHGMWLTITGNHGELIAGSTKLWVWRLLSLTPSK